MSIINYEFLRLIWWLLLGVLLIGFAITDGFDLGVAALLPFVARNDSQRRIAINTIAPVWEGNQVWLVLGAGAIFAAWPAIYAAAFSGFYIALFLVLVSLILRPVGFEFRDKFQNPHWRSTWDYALFVGGLVPSLVFGVAFGNILQGVPLRIDGDLRVFYEGSGLFELLNPFGLLAGLVSLSLLVSHGAVYLSLKAEDVVAARARLVASLGPLVLVVLFTLAGLWVAYGIPGYVISSPIAHDGPSNPLWKTVERVDGAWLRNYALYPWTIAAPLLGVAGALLTALFSALRRPGTAFITSGIAIFGVISTAGVSLFPFLLPSSIAPNTSLTVWDASSSQRTLFVMLIATMIFLPIVLAYTSFVFRTLRGPVSASRIVENSQNLY